MTTSRPPDNAEPGEQPASRLRRRRRLIGVAVLCIGCSTLAIWSARRTIGTALVDRKLAAAQVRARYRIVDLGLGRQRLVDVVIGDPGRPDLTADWIELRTRLGFDGAAVTAVRAGGLRLRATVTDSGVSLGEIDRLLPASTGRGAFRFPAIDLDVADARAQVTSALGVVGISLSGHGRLDGGFRGRAIATGERLAIAGCIAQRASLTSTIAIDGGEPTLTGPLRADRFACPGAAVDRPAADLAVTLTDRLTGWRGRAALGAERVAGASFASRRIAGRVSFAGTSRVTTGDVSLTGGPARVASVAGRSVSVSGRYRLGRETRFAGLIRAAGIAAPASVVAAIERQRHAAASMPVAPLLDRAAGALASAARDFDVAARVAFGNGVVTVTRLDAVARTGAAATILPTAPIRVAGGAVAAIAGTASLSGGGLPDATVRFVRSARGDRTHGVATIAPYATGTARLALDPVRFQASARGVSIATVATLSGPLPGGRVDGMRLPIAAEWDGARTLAVDPGCTTVTFDRLAVATLRLRPAQFPLCADGPALVRVRAGVVAGGARISRLRLGGTLGSTPLTLAADDMRITLAGRRAEARGVVASLGAGEAATRLAIGRLAGALFPAGVGGRFEGAAGRIGKVPLLLSAAAGDWRFAHGALSIDASATVADASPAARFKPLRADAIRLRLADGAIGATGTLVTPERAVRVADVTLSHDLARGTGSAALAVPKLAFTEGFQPDALTPLTFGVVADVRGTVTGEARINWSPQGATGTGTFGTDRLDLAAAFGPVTGLAGTLHFTDLLSLATAPDQVATVASINPGVPVTDGRIVFRLLPEGRVQVASGHWPFAGGSLDLRPTTLTFGGASERRLTFALDGVDAGRFLQQFDFGNLSATGTFDGTLPMVFDASGGRIEGGQLRVRRGGGNLAYLGELTQKDLGTWGNLAFQALRSIDYRDLAIVMNGPLAGEMITEVRFAGVSQGKGARSNFLIRRLQKLPLVFNIRIQAPFRGLIDSAQSFYDPSRLVSRNLPALIRQQNDAASPTPAIQPGASGPRP